MAIIFPIFWIILHYVQNGRIFGFMADTSARYTKFFGYDTYSLMINNPLTQFIKQNILTLNIVGVLLIPSFYRKNKNNKYFLLIPFSAFLMITLIALFGNGLPSHSFWRVPALWSFLLVLFTAHWFFQRLDILRSISFIQKGIAQVLFLGLFALCVHQLLTETEMTAFDNYDLAAGRFVNKQLRESSPDGSGKILIETNLWPYVNVMIASQHPERFIYNSGFDPATPEIPLLKIENPPDIPMLKKKGIDLLVFWSFDYKICLDKAKDVKKLGDFGPWRIYSIR